MEKNIIKNTYKDTDETIYLYTEEGVLLSMVGRSLDTSIIESKEYYNSLEDVYVEESSNGTYYILTEKIDQLKLTAITMISNEILTYDSRKVSDLIIILCIINFPIYIIIANFLYGNIAKPINVLIEKKKEKMMH